MTTVACPACQKEGRKCAACEIKDLGFVQKSEIEAVLKEVHSGVNDNNVQPGRADPKDGEHSIAAKSVVDHMRTCTNEGCAVHQEISNIANEAYSKGIKTGRSFST